MTPGQFLCKFHLVANPCWLYPSAFGNDRGGREGRIQTRGVMAGTHASKPVAVQTDYKRTYPPGHVKIVAALKTLLEKKSFHDITWAEIAKTAGVSEALIYQHFKDRRGLLYFVLGEYLSHYVRETRESFQHITGALNRLRRLVFTLISVYNDNRVFARMLLLEIRGYADFYQSDSYQLARDLGNAFLSLIEEGIASGEIAGHVSPRQARQVMIGAVEHMVLPKVIFNRPIDPESLTEDVCALVFHGIAAQAENDHGQD